VITTGIGGQPDTYNRLVGDDIANGNCAGRIRICVWQSAKGRTAADRYDGKAMLGGFLEHIEIADTSNRRICRVANRYRPVYDKNIFA
jgi:hypothetical protein